MLCLTAKALRYLALTGAFTALLIFLPATAEADPLTVDVTAGTRFSDNINKQQGDGRDEFEHRVGVRLSKRTDSGQCRGSLMGDVDFLTYQRNTFSDRFSASADLNGLCEPTPWLRWNLRNTLRDARQNRSEPETPANRELRNVFSTGPTLTWFMGRRDNLFLDLDYQLTRFENSSSEDSNRYTVTSGWQRLFTRRWQGGISGARSQIEFPRSEEELTQDNISVSFARRDRLGHLSGTLGHTWLESQQGMFDFKAKALTGQLNYTRQFEGGTQGAIQLRRDLTDISTDIDVFIPDLELNLQETSAVKVTGVSVTLSQPLPKKSNLSLELGYTESDYQLSDTREDRYSAGLELSRELGDRLAGKLDLSYRREKFDQDNSLVAHTYRPQLGIDYRQSRDLTWDLLVGMERRHDEGRIGRRYEERFISAGVTWNLR